MSDKQFIKEIRSKIKHDRDLYKLNCKKFKDLKLLMQTNKQLTEEEILSKINDIKNSKDYIEPLDVNMSNKELKLFERFLKRIIIQTI